MKKREIMVMVLVAMILINVTFSRPSYAVDAIETTWAPSNSALFLAMLISMAGYYNVTASTLSKLVSFADIADFSSIYDAINENEDGTFSIYMSTPFAASIETGLADMYLDNYDKVKYTNLGNDVFQGELVYSDIPLLESTDYALFEEYRKRFIYDRAVYRENLPPTGIDYALDGSYYNGLRSRVLFRTNGDLWLGFLYGTSTRYYETIVKPADATKVSAYMINYYNRYANRIQTCVLVDWGVKWGTYRVADDDLVSNTRYPYVNDPTVIGETSTQSTVGYLAQDFSDLYAEKMLTFSLNEGVVYDLGSSTNVIASVAVSTGSSSPPSTGDVTIDSEGIINSVQSNMEKLEQIRLQDETFQTSFGVLVEDLSTWQDAQAQRDEAYQNEVVGALGNITGQNEALNDAVAGLEGATDGLNDTINDIANTAGDITNIDGMFTMWDGATDIQKLKIIFNKLTTFDTNAEPPKLIIDFSPVNIVSQKFAGVDIIKDGNVVIFDFADADNYSVFGMGFLTFIRLYTTSMIVFATGKTIWRKITDRTVIA